MSIGQRFRWGLLCIACFAPAMADSWRLPEKTAYYSAGKQYRLEVTPKQLSSQLAYFEDKVGGARNAGAANRKAPETARAVLGIRGSLGRYRRIAAFRLVNEVAPVHALVSTGGEFLVTFDNWHSAGYGDSVVVIYRANGTLVRQLGLEDLLTDPDLGTLAHTASSRWWGDGHWIDEEKKQLVLRVTPGGTSGQPAATRELRIDLQTGNPLEPKGDLFRELHPKRLIRLGVPSNPVAKVDTRLTQPAACSVPRAADFDSSSVARLESEALARHLQQSTPFVYPPLARQARLQGAVVADVLVDEMGKVQCVRLRSGHPLFAAEVVSGLLASTLDPSVRPGRLSVGTVLVEFLY